MRLRSIFIILQTIGWLCLPAALLGQAGKASTEEQACARMKQLGTPSYESYFGRQEPVDGESSGWNVQLVKREAYKGCVYGAVFLFRATEKRSGTVLELRLCTESLQIDEVDIISGTRALILGRAGAGFSVADIVELPSGKLLDQFMCVMPAISPDHRFLAFVKSFPGHPGPVSVSDEYIVYDLKRDPAYNRPHFKPGVTYDSGWPVYPPGATNAVGENLIPGLDSPVHTLFSGRLFWLNGHTLAFTDFFPGENRLVVVNLSDGIRDPRVRTSELSPSQLVDLGRCKKSSAPSDFAKWSEDPAGLIRVRQIAPAPLTGVCLRFVTSPCLKYKYMLVRLP